ncbi:DUF1700 domain-containing protein [Ruminococcaceae bacterium OttesenSCG-928-A16]|nr:DUF1700 domain-containing protein [Ruminococcaceae bacterium OttesenSCG-928-A16]
MNKIEFLQELEQELASVSTDERVAALQYFTMYFEDAGPEHEAEVMAELGSPQKIAADIRASSGVDGEGWVPPAASSKPAPALVPAPNAAGGQAPFAPLGQPPAAPGVPRQQAPANAGPAVSPGGVYPAGAGGAYANGQAATVAPPPKTERNKGLLILLLIVLSPLWLAALSVVFALFISLVVVLAVPVIIGVVFIASAVAVFIACFFMLPFNVGGGLFNMGVAIVLLALGILAFWFGTWALKKVVPATVRAITRAVKSIF